MSHASTAMEHPKVCPICGKVFKRNGGSYGWYGLDRHWRTRHADLCSYEAALAIIKGMESPPTAPTRSEQRTGQLSRSGGCDNREECR